MAVSICIRQRDQSLAGTQRISWWSSTIKKLFYVNLVNPLLERNATAAWFHAWVAHWMETLSQCKAEQLEKHTHTHTEKKTGKRIMEKKVKSRQKILFLFLDLCIWTPLMLKKKKHRFKCTKQLWNGYSCKNHALNFEKESNQKIQGHF